MRNKLSQAGMQVLGRVSPLVLPLIGEERVARRAYEFCLENGLILNNLEYPACRRGAARFRLQLTPHHVAGEICEAADILQAAIRHAQNCT